MTFIHVHQRPVFDLPARDDNKTRVIPTAYEPRPEEAVSNPYDPREARTCILTSEFWLLASEFFLVPFTFINGHFVFGRPFRFRPAILVFVRPTCPSRTNSITVRTSADSPR